MTVKIRSATQKDVASYRQCIDAIAKERRYFFEYEASPLAEFRALIRETLRKKAPFLIAVDGERVVGFASVLLYGLPSLSHNARIGIGILPEYRDIGLGTKLTAGVLKMARGKFDFLFLEVFAKNKRARKLYMNLGFEVCGRIKKNVKGLVYGYDDVVLMQKQMRR